MITNFTQIASVMAILAIGLLVRPAPATANGIPVSTPSDILTVFDGSGAKVYSVSATEDSESDNAGQLFFINHADLVNSDMLDARIFLCDPKGKISDVFGIFKLDDSGDNWDNGKNGNNGNNGNNSNGSNDSEKELVLGFISDPLDFDSKQCGKTITCVPEGSGGSPGNATLFLSEKLIDKGYTATFMSDSEVPEPATTGLFFGMGALGLCIWKRRRTTA